MTNTTQIQIAQANDITFINELYTAASQCVADDWQTDKALSVIELIEDGKYLEAVMIPFNF